jgi:hypothetical protein
MDGNSFIRCQRIKDNSFVIQRISIVRIDFKNCIKTCESFRVSL